jgi:CheY-like chemotaxis protein
MLLVLLTQFEYFFTRMMGKNLNILLADDDNDDREIFSKAMLEVDPSTSVETASDGLKLMDTLSVLSPTPDLLFLDLNMPLKNGLECLKDIKLNTGFAKIPVIIYSTSMSPQEVEMAWSLGALYFVRKPDSYRLLKDILKNLIQVDFNTIQKQSREKFIFKLV